MTAYSGIAKGHLRYVGKSDLRFTREGMDEFHAMLSVGCPMDTCADFFCVEDEWLAGMIKPGQQCYELYRSATATFKRSIHTSQLALANENAQMAKHLGAHALGQPKDPVPVDPNLADQVIGAFPDWEAKSDSWTDKHKPTKQVKSTIDQLKDMRVAAIAEEAADDAAAEESETADV